MLNALLLALGGCRVGEVNAIVPADDDTDFERDDAAISGSESPSVGAFADAASVADAGVTDASSDEDAAEVSANDAACSHDRAPCGPVPQGCATERFEQHTYLFCDERLPWESARARCQEAGLDMVIVETEAENAFVAGKMGATSWLGAHDSETEGSFHWVEPGGLPTGAALTFTRWAPLVPDNCGGLFGQQDCVRVSADGSWDDSDCAGGCLEQTFAFVCESY
jgi:hypothetical protein